MRAPLIRNLVGGIGLAVALVIAVAVPLGYFAQGYLHLSEALEFKSVLSAGRVAKHVYANERLWQFQSVRLFELIELPDDAGVQVRQRIIRADGRLVVEQDRTLATPVERFRQPIVVRDEVVAWLEAETSLRPLLINTAWATALSSLLGLVA